MINAEKLKEVGIDYDEGLKRFMDDADLFEAVLKAFLDLDIREIAKPAFESRDTEKLQDVIHEAKGSCGNAGFTTLYEEASALVLLLRSKSFTDEQLVELYTRFEREYTKVYSGIKAALQ